MSDSQQPAKPGLVLPLADQGPSPEIATTPEPLVCSDDSVEHFHERQHCIQCHRIYCPHFQSSIDSNFCRVCLFNSDAIEVRANPLKDAEGIAHEGRHLMPIGSIYKTLPRAIVDMSDGELDDYVKHMRQEVKNAEARLQYTRIGATMGDMEQGHRAELASRRLRGVKVPGIGSAMKISASIKPGASSNGAKDIAEKLKNLGITPEMLMAALAAKGGKKP
jgi:hypothetical protein